MQPERSSGVSRWTPFPFQGNILFYNPGVRARPAILWEGETPGGLNGSSPGVGARAATLREPGLLGRHDVAFTRYASGVH